jgi:hypothetical protein
VCVHDRGVYRTGVCAQGRVCVHAREGAAQGQRLYRTDYVPRTGGELYRTEGCTGHGVCLGQGDVQDRQDWSCGCTGQGGGCTGQGVHITDTR